MLYILRIRLSAFVSIFIYKTVYAVLHVLCFKVKYIFPYLGIKKWYWLRYKL